MSGADETSGDYIEICGNHLTGSCSKRPVVEEHRFVHHYLPYLWQILQPTKDALSFPDQYGYELERAYCQLADNHFLQIPSGPETVTQVAVDFDAMMAKFIKCDSANQQSRSYFLKLRRLTTCSYINNLTVDMLTQSYVTQWRWYYLDDKSWKCFGGTSVIPSQSVLESKYLSDRQSLYLFDLPLEGEFIIALQASEATRTMRRMRDGCEWRVRRRPLLVTPQQVTAEQVLLRLSRPVPKLKAVMFAESVPSDWTPVDTEQEAELVPMNPDSMAYHLVASEFERTVPRSERHICDIFRVQNPYLWHKYYCRKMVMERKGKPVNETQLFHGTRDDEAVRSICSQNFDWRLSGSVNARAYGNGAYFAIAASFSERYAHKATRGRSWMFLARTILGATAIGAEGMVRPPPINPTNPQEGLYDSCTNNTSNPTIYVIFDSDQCYPEYLISYTGLAGTS